MYKQRSRASKPMYVFAFVWLCACTFLFSLIAPSIAWGAHGLLRVITGVEKIIYSKELHATPSCVKGVSAIAASPYNASLNGKSTVIFNEPTTITAGYAYDATNDVVIGTIDRTGSVISLTPFYATDTPLTAYSQANIMLTLVPKGSGTYTADVPKESTVSLGEPVTIAIHNELKTIGTIVSIHDEAQSPIKTITVRSALDLKALQSVCVVSA